jgi:hypothetical protein
MKNSILKKWVLLLTFLLVGWGAMAQDWNQIIKTAAGDRMAPFTARSAGDNYGYSVCVDGNYAVVGAYQSSITAGRTGTAYILYNNGGTWQTVKQLNPLDPAADDYFGFSVSISGGYVIIGAYQEDEDASGANTATGAGSAYIFAKDQGGTDNWGQVRKIVASDRAGTDYFGWSVSISGSYAIVGAKQEDEDAAGVNPFFNAGSAYVFAKDQGGTGNWGQVKKIVASDRATNDSFGSSVSISGSYVIVGAYFEDEDAAGAIRLYAAGSAYVFAKDQGGTDNWGQVKKIVPSDRAIDDWFGFAVSISGSYIVVGARYEDDNASGGVPLTNAGSAYLFAKDQGGTDNWGQVKKIVASDRAESDNFGYSVSISGNYVVVGASNEDENATGGVPLDAAGSAYLFAKDQGGTDNWGQVKKIVPSDRAVGDYFGFAVSISGSDVIVGAYQESEDASGANTLNGAGSAYLFSKDQGGTDNWGQTTKTVAEGSKYIFGNRYGTSVAIDGNYAVVGASYEDKNAAGANVLADAGAAYVLKYNGTTWSEIKKIVPSDRAASDYFGCSVSISGSYVLVGAHQEDENATGEVPLSGAGSAYLFAKDQGGTDNWGEVKKIVASDRAANDAFGYKVSVSGNYVLVGAYMEDDNATGGVPLNDAGSAYIFAKDQGGTDNWGQVKKIVASDRTASDNFGIAVSISGSYVLVGANNEDEDASGGNPFSSAGSAYLFAKDQGGTDNWGQVKKIVASDRAAGDQFGYAVSISGNYLIVGAYQEDEDASGGNKFSSAGSAYLFSKDQGGANNWGEVKKIVASDRAISDQFGYTVSISGSYVIVGAYYEDEDASGANALSNAGSAFIFGKDQGGADTWGQVRKIVPSDRAVNDQFGYSVSISGIHAIVGAYTEDEDASGANTLTDAGSAYIFRNSLFTWDGSESTEWNTAANWDSNTVPTATDNVLVPHLSNDPVVNLAPASAAVCKNLTIEPGTVLTVAAGKALTVNNALTNNAGTTGLVVKSDATGTGSLKILGSTSASATVERIMEPAKWHIVSAPAIEDLSTFLARNKSIPNVSTDATILGMKDYSTSGNSWNGSYTTSTSGMMNVGKGYLVRTETLTPTSGEPTVLDFNGTLNVGNKEVTVSLSGTKGWNCIGNPYTSAIKLGDGTEDATGLDNFLDVNNLKMDDASFGAYVYTGTGTGTNGYTVINYASPYNGVDTYASLGQGFFVKANTDGATLSFTPAMQFHIGEGVAPFKAAVKPAPSIKLTVANNVSAVSTDILFIDGTTKGLDKGYDAGIFKADPSFAIYTKLVEPFDAEFQLQCLPTDQYDKMVIPVGIDCKAGGEIVFSVQTVQLDPTCKVILEDKLTHTFTDLSKNSYKVTVAENTSTSERFFLHTGDIISGLEDQELAEGGLTAYANGNKEIRVLGEVGEGAVATLVNGLGQVVLTKKLDAGNLNIIGLPNLSSGLFLLNINDKGTAQTIKIMIRK